VATASINIRRMIVNWPATKPSGGHEQWTSGVEKCWEGTQAIKDEVKKVKAGLAIGLVWTGTESNRRHMDFQSVERLNNPVFRSILATFLPSFEMTVRCVLEAHSKKNNLLKENKLAPKINTAPTNIMSQGTRVKKKITDGHRTAECHPAKRAPTRP
jgi:hypothetical protein